MLAFLICGSQVVGDESVKPDFFKKTTSEPDLLEAALKEMKENESEKKNKRKLAKKDDHQTQQPESSDLSSSSRQNFDFGDVVVTISEREMENVPHVYLKKTTDQAPSLTVKKSPNRKTSSVKSQKQTQRESSSE